MTNVSCPFQLLRSRCTASRRWSTFTAIVVIWPLSSHTLVNRSGLFNKSLLVCRLLKPTFLASNVTELNFYKIDHWLMIGLCLELCVFVWFQAATTWSRSWPIASPTRPASSSSSPTCPSLWSASRWVSLAEQMESTLGRAFFRWQINNCYYQSGARSYFLSDSNKSMLIRKYDRSLLPAPGLKPTSFWGCRSLPIVVGLLVCVPTSQA